MLPATISVLYTHQKQVEIFFLPTALIISDQCISAYTLIISFLSGYTYYRIGLLATIGLSANQSHKHSD